MNNVAILNQLQRRVGSANWKDWQIHRWVWYDFIRYPTAGTTAPLSFFVVPQGGSDPNNSTVAKSLEQTNMAKGGSFGQTYFFIHQIRSHIHILPKKRQATTSTNITTDADYVVGTAGVNLHDAVQRLAGQGVLKVTIGQKGYFEIEKPFKNAPSCLGVEIYQHGQVGAGESIWFQQSHHCKDVWSVTPPQMVEPEQTFTVQLEFPNGASPALTNVYAGDTSPFVNLGVLFDGYIARPAQ